MWRQSRRSRAPAFERSQDGEPSAKTVSHQRSPNCFGVQ
jgi:hypothetical protein